MILRIGEGRKNRRTVDGHALAHPWAQISARAVGLKAVRKLGTHVGIGEILEILLAQSATSWTGKQHGTNRTRLGESKGGCRQCQRQ